MSFGLLQPHNLKTSHDKQQSIPSGMMASRWLLAVPFLGKDRPSDASEFAHPVSCHLYLHYALIYFAAIGGTDWAHCACIPL